MADQIQKFLRKLDIKTQLRLLEKFRLLDIDHRTSGDIKNIVGQKSIYRLRMGSIRLVYKVMDYEVEVIWVGYRGDNYKSFLRRLS